MSTVKSSGLHLKNACKYEEEHFRIERLITSPTLDTTDFMWYPFITPEIKQEFEKRNIGNIHALKGRFQLPNWDFTQCAHHVWNMMMDIKDTSSIPQTKRSIYFVQCVFFKLEMMGYKIPQMPEGWEEM